MLNQCLLIAASCVILAPAFAGEADVIDVTVNCRNDSVCDFSVTVRHADDGWDHYADGWEVRTLDGEILAVRELLHPHDDEQPFTRSLTNVKIPDGVNEVVIRARDSVHEYGGREITVKLQR
jgi:hypothetical protein